MGMDSERNLGGERCDGTQMEVHGTGTGNTLYFLDWKGAVRNWRTELELM